MKILLPLDDAPCSTAALDAVVEQFHPHGTEIRLLHVVEWPKHLSMSVAMGEGPSAATDLMASRNRAFREGGDLVARAAARLRAAGFEATENVVAGDARETIIDAARTWEPDLIVIGSHGWKGLDRLVMGSVSDAIVRRADCSVEVIRVPGHLRPTTSVAPPS
jgi:nucleotide-binding universal stress UspA family protein